MRGALDETIADTRVREAIYERMAGLADWMRNQADNPHDARRAH
jgi:hemoglobin